MVKRHLFWVVVLSLLWGLWLGSREAYAQGVINYPAVLSRYGSVGVEDILFDGKVNVLDGVKTLISGEIGAFNVRTYGVIFHIDGSGSRLEESLREDLSIAADVAEALTSQDRAGAYIYRNNATELVHFPSSKDTAADVLRAHADTETNYGNTYPNKSLAAAGPRLETWPYIKVHLVFGDGCATNLDAAVSEINKWQSRGQFVFYLHNQYNPNCASEPLQDASDIYLRYEGVPPRVEDILYYISMLDHAPIANADFYTANGVLSVTAPGVLNNDTDIDDDDLTARLKTNPTKGLLDLNSDGSFIYTPQQLGTDSFTYQALGYREYYISEPATVTITINSLPIQTATPKPCGGACLPSNECYPLERQHSEEYCANNLVCCYPTPSPSATPTPAPGYHTWSGCVEGGAAGHAPGCPPQGYPWLSKCDNPGETYYCYWGDCSAGRADPCGGASVPTDRYAAWTCKCQ